MFVTLGEIFRDRIDIFRSAGECATSTKEDENVTIWAFNATSKTCSVGSLTFLVFAADGLSAMVPSDMKPAGKLTISSFKHSVL